MIQGNIYIWSAINRFGTQVISFVGNILLARQLSPEDYGLVAMLAIIMGIAWNFTESGFSDCLIQKNDAGKKDFGTVLTFNVGMSLVMYLAIFALAPLVAGFFERTELIDIGKVLGISIIIRAFTVTEITRLRKELQFKTITIIEICSSIISITIALLMALHGYGYWAIVFQTLTSALSSLILIIIVTGWRPFFYFSRRSFSEMSGFSFNLLVSYFANQMGKNLYAFFIGKFHSTFSLGFYRQAQKINDAPVMGLNAVILTTTYPLLAKETNREKRQELYKSLLNRFLFLQFLMCAFLIGAAYPLFDILLGEKWLPTVPFFQIMVVAYLFYPLMTINYNIAKVHGRAGLYRNLTFLRNALLVISLALTMKYPITVIISGQIIALWLSTLVSIIFCGKIIDFGVLNQLRVIARQIWIPAVGMAVAAVLSQNAEASVRRILILSGFFFSIFIGLNEISRSETYLFFKAEFFLRFKSLLKIARII